MICRGCDGYDDVRIVNGVPLCRWCRDEAIFTGAEKRVFNLARKAAETGSLKDLKTYLLERRKQ